MTSEKITSDCTLFLLSMTQEVHDLEEAVWQLQSAIELRKSIREEGRGTITESFNQKSPLILSHYESFFESMALVARKIHDGLLQFHSKVEAANIVQVAMNDSDEVFRPKLKQFRADYITLLEVLNLAGGNYKEWEQQLSLLKSEITKWGDWVEKTSGSFSSGSVATKMSSAINNLIDCFQGDLCPVIRCECSVIKEKVVGEDISLEEVWELILSDNDFVFLSTLTTTVLQLKNEILKLQLPFAEERMKRLSSV